MIEASFAKPVGLFDNFFNRFVGEKLHFIWTPIFINFGFFLLGYEGVS